jgi:hypothetical protein
MITVEKATFKDFDRIYQFLQQENFLPPHLSKDDLRPLYTKNFPTHENYCGYLLKNQNEIIGKIGCIFSLRKINGQEHKFCNLTTWLVKDGHRGKGISLLMPILKLRNYTITALTPGRQAYLIYKKLGFKELEKHMIITLPLFNPFRIFSRKAFITNEIDVINQELSNNFELATVLNDHANFNCKHLLIRVEDELCYIIIVKVTKKNVPMAIVHFISNPDLFMKYIENIKFYIAKQYRLFFVVVEKRFINANRIDFSYTRSLTVPSLYKSASLEARHIDNLYSERILLNS